MRFLLTTLTTPIDTIGPADTAAEALNPGIGVFFEGFVKGCIDVAARLLWAAVAMLIGTLIIKLIIRYFPNGTKRKPLDPTVRNFLRSATKFVLYIIVIVIVIGILGIPLASVITVIASAGAAIALALQGSLANIASGIMLLIFKPLKIGDYIEAGSTSGTVIDVGLFYTSLTTPDGKRVEIPNSKLTADSVVNYSVEKNRRVELVFPVAYGTDTERVKELIHGEIKKHEKILKEPLPTVRLTELADSSLNITVRVFCANADFWDVKFDMTERIKALLDREGISVPFRQVDVHIKND